MELNKVTADELTDEQKDMAHNLAGWKNSLYEATMSDYPIDSITRAERGVEAAEQELTDEGIDPESVVVWSDTRGCWTVA